MCVIYYYAMRLVLTSDTVCNQPDHTPSVYPLSFPPLLPCYALGIIITLASSGFIEIRWKDWDEKKERESERAQERVPIMTREEGKEGKAAGLLTDREESPSCLLRLLRNIIKRVAGQKPNPNTKRSHINRLIHNSIAAEPKEPIPDIIQLLPPSSNRV